MTTRRKIDHVVLKEHILKQLFWYWDGHTPCSTGVLAYKVQEEPGIVYQDLRELMPTYVHRVNLKHPSFDNSVYWELTSQGRHKAIEIIGAYNPGAKEDANGTTI